ncbi:MAG: hypothetical protein ABIE70_04505 [bacterium]
MTEQAISGAKPPSKLWVIFPITLGVLCVVLLLVVEYYYEQYHQLSDDYNSLYFRAQQAEDDMVRYRRLVAVRDSLGIQLHPTLTTSELAALNRKGLTDPLSEIVNDLTSNPHLTNVDMGELYFEMPSQVCVLGPDRVLAAYDSVDGSGFALLAFDVDDRGRIEWELLERTEN